MLYPHCRQSIQLECVLSRETTRRDTAVYGCDEQGLISPVGAQTRNHYSSKSIYADDNKSLSDEEKESVKSKVEEIKKWIDENQEATKEEYETKFKEFSDFIHPITQKMYNGNNGNVPGGNEGVDPQMFGKMPEGMTEEQLKQMAEMLKNGQTPPGMENMADMFKNGQMPPGFDPSKMADMFKQQKDGGVKVEDVD